MSESTDEGVGATARDRFRLAHIAPKRVLRRPSATPRRCGASRKRASRRSGSGNRCQCSFHEAGAVSGTGIARLKTAARGQTRSRRARPTRPPESRQSPGEGARDGVQPRGDTHAAPRRGLALLGSPAASVASGIEAKGIVSDWATGGAIGGASRDRVRGFAVTPTRGPAHDRILRSAPSAACGDRASTGAPLAGERSGRKVGCVAQSVRFRSAPDGPSAPPAWLPMGQPSVASTAAGRGLGCLPLSEGQLKTSPSRRW
jgi:hypothetical protein